ncbi:hypothetical protein KJE20_13979 [Pyrenophora tritici-repentis]|nr:hypothetical protein KJE20_13979 [Pyrenophora tritici-repentis]
MPTISSRELKELGIDPDRDLLEPQTSQPSSSGRRHTRASSASSSATSSRVDKRSARKGKRGATKPQTEASNARNASVEKKPNPRLRQSQFPLPSHPSPRKQPTRTLAEELAAAAVREGTDDEDHMQEPPGSFPRDSIQRAPSNLHQQLPSPPPTVPQPTALPPTAPQPPQFDSDLRPTPTRSPTSSDTQTPFQTQAPFASEPPQPPAQPRNITFQPPSFRWPGRPATASMSNDQGPAGPDPAGQYSLNKYRRDAMILLELEERQRRGDNLPGFDQPVIFTETELATARTVQRMMRRTHREEVRQRAREYLRETEITPHLLNEWRLRFNNGPDDVDEEDEPEPTQSRPPPVASSLRNNPSAPPFPRSQASIPPISQNPLPQSRLNPSRYPTSPPRRRHRSEETEEVRRHFSPPGRSPTRRQPMDHTRYVPPARQMSMPGSHRRSRNHRRSPSDSSSSDSGSDRSRRGHRHGGRRHRRPQAQPDLNMFNQRRLKPEEMGIFDGQNMSVHLYVRQIQHRVRLYGYQRVLEVLPLCMKGAAMDWYTSLSDSQLSRMTTDIDEWIIALRHRFQKDAMLAEDEANRCKHSFEHESLDKIWRDLDPTLQNAVTIDPYMTMEDFVSLCYQKEYSARRMFEQQRRQANGQLRVAAQEFARRRQDQPSAYRPALQPRTTNAKALPEPPRPALKSITSNRIDRPLAQTSSSRTYGQKRVAFMMDLLDQYNDCEFSDENPVDIHDEDEVQRSDEQDVAMDHKTEND